jgi:hypothetical protein
MTVIKENIIIVILFILTLTATYCRAGINGMQVDYFKDYELPLRWDNIETSAQLVTGPEPQYNASFDMHTIDLTPGSVLKIVIPEHEMLRIYFPMSCIPKEDLKISLSNGTGLHRFLPVSPDADNQSLLVKPSSSNPTVCRIFLPWCVTLPRCYTQAHGDLNECNPCFPLALFLSRKEMPPQIAPYRDLIPLSGTPINLVHKKTPGSIPFWPLDAQKPAQFRINGPARILVENRFIYPKTEQKRRIKYYIELIKDGIPCQLLDFNTLPEIRESLWVRSSVSPRAHHDPIVCGRLRQSYINIPEGEHVFTLVPHAAMLLRVLRLDDPDYLFPSLNTAEKFEAISKKPLPRTVFHLNRNERSSVAADIAKTLSKQATPSLPVPHIQKALQQIARDNRRPHGGLAAAGAMKVLSERLEAIPQIRSHAQILYDLNTFFRNLFPGKSPKGISQESIQFILPRLKRERDSHMVVAQQHIKQLQQQVQTGYFFPLPDQTSPLIFKLPHRVAPSTIRLVAPCQSQSQSFVVQFDARAPIRFEVASGNDVGPEKFRITSSDAAQISRIHFFSPEDDPIDLSRPIRPAFFELDMPKDIRQMAVWRDADQGHPHLTTNSLSTRSYTGGKVAVQYLDSRPYSMSESNWLQAMALNPSRDNLLNTFVQMLTSKPLPESNEAIHEYAAISDDFQSHWVPLIRLIRSNYHLFKGPEALALPASTNLFSPAKINALIKKASRFESKQQYLPAFETWTAILKHTTGKIRKTAMFKLADHLIALGDTYLAEKILKTAFFHTDPENSHIAFNRLHQLYLNGGAPHLIFPMLCARGVKYPTQPHLKSLAQALLESGRAQDAFILAGLLSDKMEVQELLLTAAYQMGWHNVVDMLTAPTTDPKERAYQKAQALMSRGAFTDALPVLNDAEERGADLAAKLERGLSIKKALGSKDRETRIQGILAWEAWQAGLPGPFRRQIETAAIESHAGTVQLYSTPRNLSYTAFVALPSRPVRAVFHGPVRLTLSARVLHPSTPGAKADSQSGVPVNGWFRVTQTPLDGTADLNLKRQQLVPIINNMPTQGLMIMGEDGMRPGTIESTELYIPPGEHRVAVHTSAISLAVTLHTKRSASPVAGLLPALTSKNAKALMTIRADHGPSNANPVRPMLLGTASACLFNDCLKIISPDDPTQAFDVTTFKRQPSLIGGAKVDNKQHACEKITPGELSAQRGQHPRTPTNKAFISDDMSHMVSRMSDLVFKASTLVDKIHAKEKKYAQEAATAREQYLTIESHARQMAQQYPHHITLGRLLSQITSHTAWEPATMVQADAGIQNMELVHWQPESRSMRIRSALFPDNPLSRQVVTNEDDLILYLNTLTSFRLQATVSLMDLPLLAPAPITFFYQLDDGKKERITLFPNRTRHTLDLPIRKGEHKLTIGMENRFANQFLKVDFCEWEKKSASCREMQLDTALDRAYYVATHQIPVIANVFGPTWIRIDKRGPNGIYSTFRALEKGRHRISLTPDKNENEALFRIHRRTMSVPPPDSHRRIRPTKLAFDPLPAPYLEIPQNAVERSPFFSPKTSIADKNRPIRFHDAYALGSQEDGTWSVRAGYHRPFSFEEDEADARNIDRHIELGATHHYFDEPRSTYFSTSFLSRFREDGGPTFGATEDIYHYPANIPIGLHLQGRLYVQDPNADKWDELFQGDTEGALHFKVGLFQKRRLGLKSYHLPSMTLFGRYMSLTDTDAFPGRIVDRDLFSRYKHDHPWGLRLSDSLSYRPWRDSLCFLQGGITFNEDFNLFEPDNIRLKAGWKQMLGDVNATLDYRHTYYFEDGDRDQDIHRNFLNLGLDWQYWKKDQQRFQFSIDLSQDLDHQETACSISMTWFFSKGHALKNIRPGAFDFYDLQRLKIPQTMNNRIEQ